jgi:hypothetical protein
MKMIMHVTIPHEAFNAAVKDGSVEQKIARILDETKPEAVYFTNYEGHRGAIMIVDISEPSKVPFYAEPWFLVFNATVDFHIVMTPADIGQAGLGPIGKKWK